ncbi:MAG: hypothetical protein GX893_01005 [Firmicutes bacterium]|nr:hypothetical protein [Bacillota bacterium]
MYMVKLVISCVLLVLGMVILPPLTGSGAGSLVTRLWFAFALLVFSSHHSYYRQQLSKMQNKEKSAETIRRTARRQFRISAKM